MGRYTSLFEEAAKVVDETPQYPGQTIPGVWETTSTTSWTVLIGVIMGNALAAVCQSRNDCVFEHALDRLMQVTAGVEVELKGDPAQIAARRLRSAAQINAERIETSIERLSRLAGIAATELEQHSVAPRIMQLCKDIRAAIGDARESGKIE